MAAKSSKGSRWTRQPKASTAELPATSLGHVPKSPSGCRIAQAAAVEPEPPATPSPDPVLESVLFVGNSNTYQPKELGGLPSLVSRVAAAADGSTLTCDALVRGGADLTDLCEEFEAHMQAREGPLHAAVLQLAAFSEPGSQLAMLQSLQHRYVPLLLEAGCRVVLYQTWLGPRPTAADVELLGAGAEVYRALLLEGGIGDVQVARAGHAVLSLMDSSGEDTRVYPALWKDDMGHPSALGGVLNAAVVAGALARGRGGCLHGQQQGSARPLGKMLASMLPATWRTASPGFAGESEFGQKAWRQDGGDAAKGMMALLHAEEDQPLSKYPPGMKTEKRSLGFTLGESLEGALRVAMVVDDASASAAPPQRLGEDEGDAQAATGQQLDGLPGDAAVAAALPCGAQPARRRWRAAR